MQSPIVVSGIDNRKGYGNDLQQLAYTISESLNFHFYEKREKSNAIGQHVAGRNCEHG
jgi:hypothetical protein